MPKLLPIKNFAQSGINSDLLPWDLDGSFLTEMNNVRISRNTIQPFGGSSLWTTLPVDFQPGFIMHVGTSTSKNWIIAGQDKVYSYDGTVLTDISNVLGYADVNDEDLWQGCLIADIPIINHPDHGPEYWLPPTSGIQLKYLPWDATNTWADVNETAQIIRSHKQFLFALDLVSNGVEISDGVRWSSPADIGGIPDTWDPLDTTNLAGITSLGAAGGKIIDGLSLRDAFVVYRERSISVFEPSNDVFVWKIRHQSSTFGLLSPDAIVEVHGKHYFISDGDILVNDGTSIKSLMHNRLRLKFTSNFNPNQFHRSFAIKNTVFGEIWFCVPSSGSDYPDIAYMYNWRDDTWAIRDIPPTPFAGIGPRDAAPISWNDTIGSWDSFFGNWDRHSITPLNDTIIAAIKPTGVGESGSLTILDDINEENPIPYKAIIERVGFALEGLNKVNTITRVYPHIKGPATVMIQIGSQDYPGSPVRWKPAVEFNPELDRKVDIRTTGELHCFRCFSEETVSQWALSGFDIEYVDAGTR